MLPCIFFAVVFSACTKGDDASDGALQTGFEDGPDLVGLPMPAPAIPDDALRAPLTGEGGTLELDGAVRVIVPPGAAEGNMELAFWRPAPVAGLLSGWEDRVRPLGQPFSLSVLGEGLLTEARLEADVVDGEIPDGWELRLLQHAPVVHPAELEPSGDRPGSDQPPWFLTCDGSDKRTITADFLSLMPDYRNDRQFQLVAVAPDITRELKLPDDKTWLCLHMIDPPVLSERTYADRVIAAFETAREAAVEMGFRLPRSPVSVTVTRSSYSTGSLGGGDRAAVAYGNLIMLRNDLHMWLPRGNPGILERAAAHEFFHVLQYNTMTEVTMNSTGPVATTGDGFESVGGNLWAIEGAATWFAWKLYPEASKRLARPAGQSLKSDPYAAWAFWAFLDERYPGVVVDVYNLAYGHALGSAGVAGRPTRPGDAARFVSGYEWLDMAEALNAALEDRSTDLSSAFADYAVSLLVWADFAEGDEGNSLFHGLWDMQQPHRLRRGAVTDTTLIGASLESPHVWRAGNWIGDELSAHALQIRGSLEPVQMANVNNGVMTINGSPVNDDEADVRMVWFSGSPTDPEDYTPKKLDPAVAGGVVLFDFAPGAITTLVYVNAGWTRYRREPGDTEGTGLYVARRASGVDFEIEAYQFAGAPDQSPIGATISVGSARKTHCVAQDASDTDEECIGNTITMALGNDQVEDGDLIEVYPGTYEESLIVDKQVALVGTETGEVIVRGDAPVTIETGGVTVANLVLIATSPLSTSNVISGLDADNVRVLNNLIINSNGGGVFFNRGAEIEVTDNWIAVPRLGIRIWESPGSTVRRNVVYPATVHDNIQRARWRPRIEIQFEGAGRDPVEWPGTEPWILTDKAIDISSSPSSNVERNVIGPATRVPTGGYNLGIHVLRSEGASVTDNTVHVYDTGISVLQSDSVTVNGNNVSGMTGITVSEVNGLTLEQNHSRSLFTALSLRRVENARTRLNYYYGGTADSYAVEVADADELRFIDETVTGMEGSAGGMRLNGGTGVTMDGTGIFGGATGLRAQDTAALRFVDSDFGANEGTALELQGTAAVTAERIGLYGGALALRVDDVRFFDIETLRVDVDENAGIIDAVSSRVRASHVYIDPWARQIVRAENARVELENVTFGWEDYTAPIIAKFDYLNFEDTAGGPAFSNEDGVVVHTEEDSILTHSWDLNTAWLSRENIMGLPFRWFVERGRLRLRAAVDATNLNLQLDTDEYMPAWRGGWHGDSPIRGAPNVPLDVEYAGSFPSPLVYAIQPLPDTAGQ
jgi:nitrous oxidase accessory protein NosD